MKIYEHNEIDIIEHKVLDEGNRFYAIKYDNLPYKSLLFKGDVGPEMAKIEKGFYFSRGEAIKARNKYIKKEIKKLESLIEE